MKFWFSQFSLFLRERGVKRNVDAFFRFLLVILIIMVLYSLLFQAVMRYEGRNFSCVTGFYWTMTVMSTLGFGDVTFQSDLGKIYSLVVLLSGVFCLLVMLPFAFIQLLYIPWQEAQEKMRAPRSVPDSVKGHIILAGLGPVTVDLAEGLTRYGFYCVLLAGDAQTTLNLLDQGYHAVMGHHDDGDVYHRLRIEQAALLAAMDTDIHNTGVVFSAHEASPDTLIIARAEKEESVDILRLAGCSRVFLFRQMLGRALARRVASDKAHAGLITRFGPLVVAEAPVMRTSLVGKTIQESLLRSQLGINVVGLWEKGAFSLPAPDTPLTEKTVLVMAGTEPQMDAFNQLMGTEPQTPPGAVIVLGGGRVGVAAAEYLRARGMDVVIVDKQEHGGVPSGLRRVHGDAADLSVLENAGIRTAPAVLITTHDDDANIYLTIYCRRLRPDIQILSRATLDRNVSTLHSAGADFVLSLVSMITSTIVNLLSPGKVFLLNEGLSIFRARISGSLAGKSLLNSNIRRDTHCNVVALRDLEGNLRVNPDPAYPFQEGEELYLIGDSLSETSFYDLHGHDTAGAGPD
jgi:Trk K+ transport system NAD-binding subunit